MHGIDATQNSPIPASKASVPDAIGRSFAPTSEGQMRLAFVVHPAKVEACYLVHLAGVILHLPKDESSQTS